MTSIEINHHFVKLIAAQCKIANGEVVVQLAGLGRDLRIVDETGQIFGTVRLDAPPKPYINEDAANCIHRGEETRTVECEGCAGNVSLKIFQCGLGGECHLGKKEIPGTTRCYGCNPACRGG